MYRSSHNGTIEFNSFVVYVKNQLQNLSITDDSCEQLYNSCNKNKVKL